jgi:hypothetical protein
MKLGLEVASQRSRMYYTERNFKPITSIMRNPLIVNEEVFFDTRKGSRFEFPGPLLDSDLLGVIAFELGCST